MLRSQRHTRVASDEDEAEGGQQGDPCVCADYAWATHGPNAELHATLKAAGGAAL